MPGRVPWLQEAGGQEGAVECWVGAEDIWGEERDAGQGLSMAAVFWWRFELLLLRI